MHNNTYNNRFKICPGKQKTKFRKLLSVFSICDLRKMSKAARCGGGTLEQCLKRFIQHIIIVLSQMCHFVLDDLFAFNHSDLLLEWVPPQQYTLRGAPGHILRWHRHALCEWPRNSFGKFKANTQWGIIVLSSKKKMRYHCFVILSLKRSNVVWNSAFPLLRFYKEWRVANMQSKMLKNIKYNFHIFTI